MRRFVTLCVLLLTSIPFGVSISGCAKTAAPTYCNGGDSGVVTTQATNITLQPLIYGISLNFAEIGQFNAPSTTDCKGSSVSVNAYTYGSTDMTIADIQPATGRVCAGTWNRNSGGGIPDFTYCTPTNKAGVAYITASADGVTSNPVPVFSHPVVANIALGSPSPGGAAAITAWSIVRTYVPPSAPTPSLVTFTAQNSYTAGQVLSLNNFSNSIFFDGITDAVVQSATPTQFTVVIPGFTNATSSATETGLATGPGCSTNPSTDCCPLGVNPVTAPAYSANSCVSQGKVAQLVARVYAGTGQQSFSGLTVAGSNVVTAVPSIAGLTVGQAVTSTVFPSGATITAIGTAPPYTVTLSANAVATYTFPVQFNEANISCQAGHLQYSATGASSTVQISPVVSIDQNGVATAEQPGSVLITANISNAASSAGFFSTCPPTSIKLAAAGTSSNQVVDNENNPLALTATALDANNVLLQNLTLEYVSTTPTTIPVNSNTVTPTLAGSASISVICQPPSCNSSSYNQLGLFGNGLPVTSNSVTVTAPGTNSTVLYMASTQSLYVETRDFTQTALAAPFLLPYAPNSMVITNDGSTIYLGSSTALMVLSAANALAISRVDITSPGSVLAVSPDGSMVVISDPVKQITTLQNSSGGIISTYGGVGTHAEFTPDNQTVYIAAGSQVLVYSTNTGWTNISPATPVSDGGTPVTDVAVTVPGVGAYFAGKSTTARGYCATSQAATVGGVTTETTTFYPPADFSAAATDRIAATNDGLHILGATAATIPVTLTDLRVEIPAGNIAGPTVTVTCPPGTQTTSSGGVTTGTTGPLLFSNTASPEPLAQNSISISAGAITGVLPTSDSSLAFITYTLPAGSAGSVPAYLPAYAPASSGLGATTYIKLAGTATAPIAGVVSADNSTVYVGTSGDNLVHIISRSTLTDTATPLTPPLAPNLVSPSGTVVPVNLMVQKPRRTT